MRFLVAIATFAFGLCLQAQQLAVLNGASFRVGQPVTSGSWAAAFGTFANVANTVASASPIPTTLGGVTVSIDGVAAPVYFVSASQINFLIPLSVQPGLRPVEIRTGSATVAGNVRVMSAAPGIFINVPATAAVPGGAAALNQDSSVNSQNNPARRGQVIQIYATGPGAISGSIADGAPAPSNPLVRTRSTPQVFIGGVAADVQFSGMAPGLAGVWQVNAVIPDQAFLSGRVPVQIFMDGVDSNEGLIHVAQ